MFTNRYTDCAECHGQGVIDGRVCTVCRGQGVRYNKYNNKRIEYNGETYDSKREYEKAVYLDQLKAVGDIVDWRPHPSYIIIPREIVDGQIIRPARYIPDFWVKYPDGREEVIDIKGFQTADWKLKAKLFRIRFKDKIKLIVE